MSDPTEQPQKTLEAVETAFPGYPIGCPLEGAVLAEGRAFRVVANNPPSPEDFMSMEERGERPKSKPTANQHCKRLSLSIYREAIDARHHLKVYPYTGKFIAAKVLTNDLGKTLLTPPKPPVTERQSHTEWWCANGINRLADFHVIE